jgi:hypothetical protein
METMYMHRVGTEQRVLLPDEIRDINNRMIGINPDSLAPKLLRQAVMNQKQKDNITPVLSCPQGMAGVERISGVQSVDLPVEPSTDIKPVRRLPFIEANTKEVCVGHLKNDCIIPVFSKDNEVTISHLRFIETIYDAANEVFRGERVDNPDVRVSHIIKGRIPEAINKPVNQLLESDKTIYYERMMFCIEIPTIHEDIAGNRLNLTIGGVRAYNQENLYSRKTFEKFKLFIGFKNMVCCNLCVSTDGYKSEIRVMSLGELYRAALELFRNYSMGIHLEQMKRLQDYSVTEAQFAQFLGRSRMYQYLPNSEKKMLPEMLMTDTQINLVTKAYYNDDNFGRSGEDKELPMWKMYNLLTGANKSSYIDSFLDRSINAGELSNGICKALSGEDEYSWFIR